MNIATLDARDTNGKESAAARKMNAVHVGLAVIGIFLGGFGTWAALAPLDGSVVGEGVLTVYGNSKTLQHREGGTIKSLLVHEGDQVRAGQVLVLLDDTQILSMLGAHLAQLADDEALCARDFAEVSGSSNIQFPSGLSELDPIARAAMERERSVFRTHVVLMDHQKRIIESRIDEARQQLVGATAQHEALLRALAYALQQLQSLTGLERVGLAGHNAILELRRSLEELRGQAGQLQSDIARHASESAELEAEKDRIRSASVAEAAHELRESQSRIDDILPRIVADRDLLARLALRAPVNGRVVDLQAFTNGGVIEPGKPILEVVPDLRRIIATTKVKPEDVEHLYPGQVARITAIGFNPKTTPAIEGRVDIISADRFVDQRSGLPYYSVEISLLNDHTNGALLKRLDPGMPVQVVVPVEPRTALEYLTEPLTNSLRLAGREM